MVIKYMKLAETEGQFKNSKKHIYHQQPGNKLIELLHSLWLEILNWSPRGYCEFAGRKVSCYKIEVRTWCSKYWYFLPCGFSVSAPWTCWTDPALGRGTLQGVQTLPPCTHFPCDRQSCLQTVISDPQGTKSHWIRITH